MSKFTPTSVKLVVFNGRSVEGILADALQAFPGASPTVVVMDDDRIQPPEGVATATVSEMAATLRGRGSDEDHLVLVANGGMSAQLVPILLALTGGWEGFHGSYAVVNLQRDGMSLLAERKQALCEGDRPVGDFSHGELKSYYNNTAW